MSDGKGFFFHLVLTFTEKATLIYDAKDEVKMKKVEKSALFTFVLYVSYVNVVCEWPLTKYVIVNYP